jgi:hypothetical protein
MIHDFLLLEMYYGPAESAQYIEDVIKKHGQNAFDAACEKGHLVIKAVALNPEHQNVLCGLSPLGRSKAEKFLSSQAI